MCVCDDGGARVCYINIQIQELMDANSKNTDG